MKIFTALFTCLVFAFATHVSAAETSGNVKLTNGEVLTGASVMSQTPTHVTFKTATGMRQIDKKLLPDDLQKKYPVDEVAAEKRKAAQAEADAKRAADLEAKKSAPKPASAVAAGAAATRSVKNGVHISFSSDPDGSGPMITLVNDTKVDQQFSKADISGRMANDKSYPLKIASRGDKLESGGAITIIGDVLKVPAYGRLEFRGYFFSNYNERKHDVSEVYFTPGGP